MCLNLDACHPVTAYLCEQGCEDPWLFFEDKGVWDQKWEKWKNIPGIIKAKPLPE